MNQYFIKDNKCRQLRGLHFLIFVFYEETINNSKRAFQILMDYFIRSVSRPWQACLLHQAKCMRYIFNFFFNSLWFQMKTVKWNKEPLQRAQQQDKSNTICKVSLEVRDLVSELGQMSIAKLDERLLHKVNLLRRVI